MRAPLGPIALEGRFIRLDPLSSEHLDALVAAAQHEAISTYLPVDLKAPGAIERRIDEFLTRQAEGVEFPFVVVDCQSKKVVGSTCYLDVSAANRAIEIGWT